MKITVIAVGKIKEKYFTGAIEEYARRLGRFCRLELIEVADEKTPEGAGAAREEQIRKREGERILKKLPENAFVAALAIEGKMLDSVELSRQMERWNVDGVSHMVFVIGGSLGLCSEVLRKADLLLSFSRMTFPHQLMRVILLEQIYRSFMIRSGALTINEIGKAKNRYKQESTGIRDRSRPCRMIGRSRQKGVRLTPKK